MKIKLIAIDMDGTLLDNKHEISIKNKLAISEAIKKGIYIILCTGRPYIGVTKYLKELNLNNKGNFCITNNGSLVQKSINGKCLYEKTLNFNDFCYLEKLSKKLNVNFHALSFDTLYTSNEDISKYTIYESSVTKMPVKYCKTENIDTFINFPKVMITDHPKNLNKTYKKIPKSVFEKYTIIKSDPCFIEFLNKETDKYKAIKFLSKHLGVKNKEIMTIGDQSNDFSMIKYSGIGIAMGNAIDEIKKISDFITQTNLNDGVAFAINKYIIK